MAIGGISGGIYGYGEGLRAKANALNQPIYANNFNDDRQIRAQMLGLANNGSATDTPSVLRLSDDEVINNALARQGAEKGFNGLKASYVLSPEQINARNGGLNASYGDALGNGVVYGKEQYMKGMPRTAGAGDVKGQFVKQNFDNWGGKAFTDYANNAFTRDRIQRADALFNKAADSVLQNKEITMRNASNPYRMSAWDGKRGASQAEMNARFLNNIDTLEGSPFAGATFAASQLSDASYEKSMEYANLASATEGLVTSYAGTRGISPAYMGANKRVVTDLQASQELAKDMLNPYGGVQKMSMGKAYENQRVSEIMSQGGSYATQVQVRAYDANGNLSSKYVYLDLIGFDKNGNLNAYDFKLSVNSPLQSNQSLLYPDLLEFGGVVTGYKGRDAGLPKNRVLQPLAVNIDYLSPKPKN